MARCSRVCGITPSSAAMTSSARSMPPTPASMFLTKRSWPGTSTISTVSPSAPRRKAKPRSMVMPRAFSSGSRSVSVPVSALTSDVLPWSMWPAVPTTTCLHASAVRMAPSTGTSAAWIVRQSSRRRSSASRPRTGGPGQVQRLVELLGRARRRAEGQGGRRAARRWAGRRRRPGSGTRRSPRRARAPRPRGASGAAGAPAPDRRERLGEHDAAWGWS